MFLLEGGARGAGAQRSSAPAELREPSCRRSYYRCRFPAKSLEWVYLPARSATSLACKVVVGHRTRRAAHRPVMEPPRDPETGTIMPRISVNSLGKGGDAGAEGAVDLGPSHDIASANGRVVARVRCGCDETRRFDRGLYL